MNTIAHKSGNKQIFLTVLFTAAFFITSTIQAQAISESDLARLGGQLSAAEKALSSVVDVFMQHGKVLGASTDKVNASSKEVQLVALKLQLQILQTKQKNLTLQREKISEEISLADVEILKLQTQIDQIANPAVKPTPRFNGFGSNELLGNVSAVFAIPQYKKDITKSVVLGKINWGDQSDSETVSTISKGLKVGTQMTVELKHAYKAPGTYVVTITDVNGKAVTEKLVINQVIEEASGPVFESAGNEAVVIKNSESTVTDDAGRFTAKFELTANDTDVYVPAVVIDGGVSGNPLNWGIAYSISAGDGKESRPGTRTATLSSTADKSGNFFVINEGETEYFTLSALFDPTAAGMYQLQLGALNWAPTASSAGIKQVQFKPAVNFATNKIQISN